MGIRSWKVSHYSIYYPGRKKKYTEFSDFQEWTGNLPLSFIYGCISWQFCWMQMLWKRGNWSQVSIFLQAKINWAEDEDSQFFLKQEEKGDLYLEILTTHTIFKFKPNWNSALLHMQILLYGQKKSCLYSEYSLKNHSSVLCYSIARASSKSIFSQKCLENLFKRTNNKEPTISWGYR